MFTSGTLDPFDSWETDLKMSFKITLINEHIINSKQNVLGGIVK